MTARVQHYRLTTTNTSPAVSARPTGELWFNYPDQRIGFIDSAKAPQDLLGVRRHAATATYATGDFVFQAGQLYRAKAALAPKAFTASDWDQLIAQPFTDGRYLQLSGGTLVGMLTLPATTPTLATHATTKGYVDGQIATAGNGRFLPIGGGTITGGLTVTGTTSTQAINAAAINATTITASGAINSSGQVKGTSLDAGSGPITTLGSINAGSGAISTFGAVTGGSVSAGGGAITGGHLTVSSLSVNANDDAKVKITSTLTVDQLAVGGDTQMNFNLTVFGTASKPGGGVWAATSDARVKTVLGPYELGLPELLKLQPVRYQFKGNDEANGQRMRHFDLDRVRVGLVAQDTEIVWPSMVTQVPGFIDDEPVNDLRILDPSELSFAVLNALRELNERVTHLEEDA